MGPGGLDRVPEVCFKEITRFKESFSAAYQAHMTVVKIAAIECLFACLEIPADAHRDGIADGHIDVVSSGFHDVKREGAVEREAHFFYFVFFTDRTEQGPFLRGDFLDKRQESLERPAERGRDDGGQP